jgi:hypothetical protein
MAFLDNSGDIILDAVLTDSGRFRLAKGDGSFKIVKYAFADDEINYDKYNKDHASGSAYYDLDILKTPILEAFTNNMSSMKHKLLSIPRTNLLYLPTMVLNQDFTNGGGKKLNASVNQAKGFYFVMVDENTEDKFNDVNIHGEINGFNKDGSQTPITVDQGLNTDAISYTFALDPDLMETRYIVEVDNRLGSITRPDGTVRAPSFIDDDNIASYTFTLGTDTNMVSPVPSSAANQSPITGPRGTRIQFSIAASIELNSSTFLFTKLGSSAGSFVVGGTTYGSGGSGTLHSIDTIVKVTGGSTGRSVDIPIRFVKITGA